jgi:2-polyprenyl-6-methoxyphenol hydroxylase-like FAD-dependent oxidoreductase
MQDASNALIVGGGFAGLSAALALSRAGLDVSVFERHPRPTEVNAGVSLWGNAIRALSKLGLARAAIEAGDIITHATLMNWHGKTISTCNIGDADRALGYPSIVIHRQDLLEVLLSALDPGVMHYNAACVQSRHTPERVILHTSDGHDHTGSILIGADGNRSQVRANLYGSEPLRYSGYTCWRGVLNYPESKWPKGHAAEVWGRGQRFGITRIGKGRVYWWATKNALENQHDADTKRDVMHAYEGWVDPVPDLIKHTREGTIIRTDICDRPPTKRWGQGRVTLVGDAAHAPTPNLGQGACMVIEDAIVLAKYLAESAAGRLEVPAALRAYERDRYQRTAMVTNVSYRLGRVGQWTNPLLCAMRDFVTSLTPNFMFLQNHKSVVGYEA